MYYKGQFLNGELHGKGKCYFASSQDGCFTAQQGEFEAGCLKNGLEINKYYIRFADPNIEEQP